MSIFQIVCIVALAIEVVVFGIYALLTRQDVDEADLIGMIWVAILLAVGAFIVLGGAFGLITLEVE